MSTTTATHSGRFLTIRRPNGVIDVAARVDEHRVIPKQQVDGEIALGRLLPIVRFEPQIDGKRYLALNIIPADPDGNPLQIGRRHRVVIGGAAYQVTPLGLYELLGTTMDSECWVLGRCDLPSPVE